MKIKTLEIACYKCKLVNNNVVDTKEYKYLNLDKVYKPR